MSLTLYVGNKRYSSWSLRPYLALAHSGLAFETKLILLDLPTTRTEIAAITPAGRMPVLHHDGLVIWDSIAICEYVHELAPAAQLWPGDRAQRAHARAISAEMHAGFTALRGNMPMDLCADMAGQGHTPDALADVRRVCEIWRGALAASGGPFLFGGFTIADAMFAPVTTRFTTYGVELDATCRAYVAAVAALPALVAWRRDAAAEPARPA
ncbi:MAG TPA: glutathione S-transferase family protein [Kofleriaceae bacterium]|jgi:glutathione S-transferase|nr:glutathione S-transferase family protein [Kofleriaceae bacterium]